MGSVNPSRHGISSIVYPVFDQKPSRGGGSEHSGVPSEEIPQADRERLQNEARLAADKNFWLLRYLSQAS